MHIWAKKKDSDPLFSRTGIPRFPSISCLETLAGPHGGRAGQRLVGAREVGGVEILRYILASIFFLMAGLACTQTVPTPIPLPTPNIEKDVEAVAIQATTEAVPTSRNNASTIQNTFTEHEFTAKVSNVRLQSQLIESGKTNDDFVTVKVSAILYPEPIVFEDVREATTLNLPEEVKFLVAYTKVNLEGSPEEIAAYWAPSIREEKMKTIGKYYEKNRELMAKHPGLTILAFIRHGDDSISAINQLTEKIVIGVTIIEKDERLYLTDTPKNDLELAIIEASFVD